MKDKETIIEGLKSEYGDFFVVEKTSGADPKNQQKNPDNKHGVSKEQFKKMSLAQRSELARTNPEVYNTLRGE